MCLVVVEGKASVTVNSESFGPFSFCWRDDCRKLRREARGNLILGQDQDSVGEMFDAEVNFSGILCKFELYFGHHEQSLREDFHTCKPTTKWEPDISSANSNWMRRNIVLRPINSSELCSSRNYDDTLQLFEHSATASEMLTLCDKFGGKIIEESDFHRARIFMNHFARHRNYSYRRFHITVRNRESETTEGNPDECKGFLYVWNNQTQDLTVSNKTWRCSIPFFHNICKFKKSLTYRLMGATTTLVNLFDEEFRLFYSRGQTYLQGLHRSRIIRREQNFVLVSFKNRNATITTPRTNNFFPIGRHGWILSQEANQQTAIQLTLTLCSESQFTCDSGECIELKNRCNVVSDCQDKSDERNCKVFHFDEANQLIGQQRPERPLKIGAEFTIKYCSAVRASSGDVVLYTTFVLKWSDDRVSFLNVYDWYHYIPVENLEKVWRPRFQLAPIKDGYEPKASIMQVSSSQKPTRKVIGSYEGERLFKKKHSKKVLQCVGNS